MELEECITCRYYLGHSDERVQCKFYPDMITGKILVLFKSPLDGWILDCPWKPVIVRPINP